MVETLRDGPSARAIGTAPAAQQWDAPESALSQVQQTQVPATGYRGEQPQPGYQDLPAAAYPDQPGTGYPDQPGTGFPDQSATGFPDQPGAAYPDLPAYPDWPAYSDHSGAAYPDHSGAAYPDQPGVADYRDGPDADSHFGIAGSGGFPDGRADRYAGDAGRSRHPHRLGTDSFATSASSLDFPSVPSGSAGRYVRDSRDGHARTPEDSTSGGRDNLDGDGAAYSRLPPAESFPYGQPPGNLEPPRQRRDTRSSLR
jgi:hypothetical protein